MTVTPGTLAPLSSVTLPLSVPAPTCASALTLPANIHASVSHFLPAGTIVRLLRDVL